MSHQAVSWALREQALTTGIAERMVLVVLAEHADPYGRNAWPSIDTVAAEAGMSRPHARRALRQLREVGAIVPEPVRGDHSPVTYRLSTPIGVLIEAIGEYLDSEGGVITGDQGGCSPAITEPPMNHPALSYEEMGEHYVPPGPPVFRRPSAVESPAENARARAGGRARGRGGGGLRGRASRWRRSDTAEGCGGPRRLRQVGYPVGPGP
jgi:hypothetical protein